MPVVDIGNNKIKYKFEIKGKYSVIIGDSGTGKTTLVDLIAEYNQVGKFSGIVNNSDTKLVALQADYEGYSQESLNSSIIFIDEDSKILVSGEYEGWMKSIKAYFVIIVRSLKLGNLPISAESVYTLKTEGVNHTLESVYTVPECVEINNVDRIIVEDSNSGCQFLKQIMMYTHNSTYIVQSSNGNAGFKKKLLECEEKGDKHFVLIYDIAGMGLYWLELQDYIKEHKGCTFIDLSWQSFENYILSTPLFNIKCTLDDCGCNYESLEQYSTEYIEKHISRYKKEKLNRCLHLICPNTCMESDKCKLFHTECEVLLCDSILKLFNYFKNLPTGYDSGFMLYSVFETFVKSQTDVKYKRKIITVDLDTDICELDDGCTVKIYSLVTSVLRGYMSIINPQVLKDWNGFKTRES